MNIVQLDGYSSYLSDLDPQPWQMIPDGQGGYCPFTTYAITPAEEVVVRAREADIVIINKVLMTDEVMAQLPRLKYIGVLATGYNVVDLEAARRRGITVTNIPAYSTDSVAQLTFAHILNIVNRVALHAQSVREGTWGKAPYFTYSLSTQTEIAGLCMGIIGYGNIGRAVARIASAFGMTVLLAPSLSGHGNGHRELPDNVRQAATMEDFFRQADIVSLHCPLTDATRHIINDGTIAMMKPSAIVINTGRGPLIDDDALARALRDGRIAAAGLDVLTEEPPRQGSPLISAPNCYITPHIAWSTQAALHRLMRTAISNVEAFLRGEPQNVVN